MGVHVRELGEDELQVFADIEQATAERRNFEYRGEAYFRKFKQAYGSKAHFMVAQIHIGEYIADMDPSVTPCGRRSMCCRPSTTSIRPPKRNAS